MRIKTSLLTLKKYVITHYIAFSVINTLILTCVCYFVNNLPLFAGENLNQYLLAQKVCEYLGWSKKIDCDDAVFINVSYDKELVPAQGEGGDDIVGSNVITDRRKLYKFLELLNKSQRYKYVLMDIMFDKDDITEYDDVLFSLLERMDKLVFVNHDSVRIACPMLKKKTARAEYYSTIIATNFVRYEYMNNDERYLPLKVFEDLYPDKKVSRYGRGRFSLYFTQGKLCQNSCFVLFDSRPFGEYKEMKNQFDKTYVGAKNYYNLGADFINLIHDSIYTEEVMIENISHLTSGKYVIIGNIKENMHDTYMGPKPGSLILFRALQTLEEGKNVVTIRRIFMWGIVYFLISLFIFKEKSILMYILPYVKNIGYKFIHYLLEVFSFSTILFCCGIVEYVCFHDVHSWLIPALYFSLIKLMFRNKEHQIA